jgi:hypothetical protein
MVHILRQRENGVPVVEVCRQHGSSEQTYYRWKKERPPCRVDLGLPNVSRVEPEAHDRDPKAHRPASSWFDELPVRAYKRTQSRINPASREWPPRRRLVV